jgi:hypothetical protein
VQTYPKSLIFSTTSATFHSSRLLGPACKFCNLLWFLQPAVRVDKVRLVPEDVQGALARDTIQMLPTVSSSTKPIRPPPADQPSLL